jgi:hypothetical protein
LIGLKTLRNGEKMKDQAYYDQVIVQLAQIARFEEEIKSNVRSG